MIIQKVTCSQKQWLNQMAKYFGNFIKRYLRFSHVNIQLIFDNQTFAFPTNKWWIANCPIIELFQKYKKLQILC